ncbi:MAG: histidine phosphatase family protein [Candidatus Micrarchaeota archaeon]
MTRLLLMRHGLTAYNLGMRIQGSIEARLIRHGKRQASDLGRRLRGEKIDALYSSGMERAVMTAKEVLRHHPHLSLTRLGGLNERNFGVFEGLGISRVREKEPRLLASENYVDFEFMPKGGESWRHVQKRAMGAIWHIVASHPDKIVGVVAHGGTNRVILASLIGLPLKKLAVFRQNNACVNILDIEGKKVRVVLLNDTGHTISEY